MIIDLMSQAIKVLSVLLKNHQNHESFDACIAASIFSNAVFAAACNSPVQVILHSSFGDRSRQKQRFNAEADEFRDKERMREPPNKISPNGRG